MYMKAVKVIIPTGPSSDLHMCVNNGYVQLQCDTVTPLSHDECVNSNEA